MGSPTGTAHFVGIVFGTYNSDIVRCNHRFGCRKSHGEFSVTVKVCGRCMITERNHYLFHVPLAAPCDVHSVGRTVGVISSEDKYRLGEYPGFRLKVFHLSE